MRFLVYMYYTHSGYQTSIFGKSCAYYIRIFTGIVKEYSSEYSDSAYKVEDTIVSRR